MRFSERLPRELRPNELAALLTQKRAVGTPIFDLTESNPTHAGVRYPLGFVHALANEASVRYEPQAFGLPDARAAVARLHQANPDRVVLTASTSEAYSWLFKLLCDPGDEVLIPRPSYPLFEYLAALESVHARHYGLFYDHGWFIDFHTIENALNERTRAIVVVNPNNPTGHFIKRHEFVRLREFGLPIISDEVFRDYQIAASPESILSLEGEQETLTFALNGLSKTVGLPQMKLAWIIAAGPAADVNRALERLEIIADTYLSVGTPVQCAVESLLELRHSVQSQIMHRVRANLSRLQHSELRVLDVEAGWYAIVRLGPGAELRLLEQEDVLVQPGYFYDFDNPNYAVISLLTASPEFEEGLRRIQRSQHD